MTYRVTSCTAYYEHVYGTAASLADAIALVPGGIMFMEEDADYPNHYDAITKHGLVVSITPIKV